MSGGSAGPATCMKIVFAAPIFIRAACLIAPRCCRRPRRCQVACIPRHCCWLTCACRSAGAFRRMPDCCRAGYCRRRNSTPYPRPAEQGGILGSATITHIQILQDQMMTVHCSDRGCKNFRPSSVTNALSLRSSAHRRFFLDDVRAQGAPSGVQIERAIAGANYSPGASSSSVSPQVVIASRWGAASCSPVPPAEC
jgi:hypothetical protein